MTPVPDPDLAWHIHSDDGPADCRLCNTIRQAGPAVTAPPAGAPVVPVPGGVLYFPPGTSPEQVATAVDIYRRAHGRGPGSAPDLRAALDAVRHAADLVIAERDRARDLLADAEADRHAQRAELDRLRELADIATGVRDALKVDPRLDDIVPLVAGLVAGVASQKRALDHMRTALQRIADEPLNPPPFGSAAATRMHETAREALAPPAQPFDLSDAVDLDEPLVADVKLDPDGPL